MKVRLQHWSSNSNLLQFFYEQIFPAGRLFEMFFIETNLDTSFSQFLCLSFRYNQSLYFAFSFEFISGQFKDSTNNEFDRNFSTGFRFNVGLYMLRTPFPIKSYIIQFFILLLEVFQSFLQINEISMSLRSPINANQSSRAVVILWIFIHIRSKSGFFMNPHIS